MRPLRFLLLLMPLLLAARLGLAQQYGCTIHGQIDDQGTPLVSQAVNIQCLSDSVNLIADSSLYPSLPHATVYTDSNGFYTVNLTCYAPYSLFKVQTVDCSGNTAFSILTVSTATPPAVNFSFNCSPCNLPAAFTARLNPANRYQVTFISQDSTTGGSSLTSTWNFGDGSPTGYGWTITHTYDTTTGPATYTVHHFRDFNFCSGEAQRTIAVGPDPVIVYGNIFAGNQCTQDSILIEYFGTNPMRTYRFLHRSGCQYQDTVAPGDYLIRVTPIAHSLLDSHFGATYYGARPNGEQVSWDTNIITHLDRPVMMMDVHLKKGFTPPAGQAQLRVRFGNNGIPFYSNYQPAGPQTQPIRVFNVSNVRVYLYQGGTGSIFHAYSTPSATVGDSEVVFTGMPQGTFRVVPDYPFMSAEVQTVQLANNQPTVADFSATVYNGLQVGIQAAAVQGSKLLTLQASPNPAQTALRLQLPQAQGTGQLRLLSADGRVVRTLDTHDLGQATILSVEGLAPGLYHAQALRQGQPVAAVRVVVGP